MSKVSHSEVRRRLGKSGSIVVDVRSSSEYREGRVPGSRHVPLGSLERRGRDLRRFKEVIFVCRSGSRSMQAVKKMEEMGFTNCRSMSGGMQAWEKAGHPVER